MSVRREVCRLSMTLLLVQGCGSADQGAVEPDSPQPPAELAFATFNTALGVGLAAYPDERLQVIAQDLAQLGADVVCLQEVWQPQHVEYLVAELATEYPHVHYSVTARSETQPDKAPACDSTETDLLGGCLAQSCQDLDPSALLLCAVANCADEFAGVTPTCQDCIVANQSSDPDSIIVACGTVGADAAAYEHQNGLVLLAKHSLKAADYLTLDSALGDRGVLFARIETAALNSVDLFCTHLAATLVEVPYAGPYQSWDGERAAQLERLLQYVDEQRDREGVAAVLGDMNCGPATAEAVGADPDTFAEFSNHGFEAPYIADTAGECTWCADNPLTGGSNTGGPSVVIDHVLFAGLPDSLDRSAQRIFDDPVRIEAEGQTVQTYRSDHFGVLITVAEPAAD